MWWNVMSQGLVQLDYISWWGFSYYWCVRYVWNGQSCNNIVLVLYFMITIVFFASKLNFRWAKFCLQAKFEHNRQGKKLLEIKIGGKKQNRQLVPVLKNVLASYKLKTTTTKNPVWVHKIYVVQ